MSTLVRPCLAVLCLLATPSGAQDRHKAAMHDSYCTIPVAKGDLVSRGKTLIVEGDQATHDAVALDGDVVVRVGATVRGVMAMRGSVTVEAGAHVKGQVAALGGDVHVAEGAILEGNVSTIGGRILADPGAKLLGEKKEVALQDKGMDPFQLLMGNILSEKGSPPCELRVKED